MTNEQQEFLRLAVVEQKHYEEIGKLMGSDAKQLRIWWDELKVEREELSALRKIWKKKFATTDFWVFKKWYEDAERKCHYCDITEIELAELIRLKEIKTKRITTRGKRLEIERKLPNLAYDVLDNLVFCCYWCNNAKTDEFTEVEFKPIGLEIGKIWKQRSRTARFGSDGSEISNVQK